MADTDNLPLDPNDERVKEVAQLKPLPPIGTAMAVPAAQPSAAPAQPSPAMAVGSGFPVPAGTQPAMSLPAAPAFQLPQPQKPLSSELWDKASAIQNPFKRTLAQIGAGAGKALDIAGSALVPGLAMNVPGSTLNTNLANRRADQQAMQVEQINQKPELAEIKGQEEERLIEEREREAEKLKQTAPAPKPADPAHVAQLAKLGLKLDATGNPVPMEETELTPELRNARTLQEAAANLKKAQTDLANSKNDPNSAAYKLEQARVDAEREKVNQAASSLGIRQEEVNLRANQQAFTQDKPYQSVLDTQTKAHDAAARMAQGDAEAGNELILQFVNAIKPESGFRLTQTEWNQILKARGLGGDVQALVQRLQSGVALTPEQSKQMIAAIDEAASIAQKHLQQNQGSRTATAPANSGAPPKGATVRSYNEKTGKLE